MPPLRGDASEYSQAMVSTKAVRPPVLDPAKRLQR